MAKQTTSFTGLDNFNYKVLNEVNRAFQRMQLKGLNSQFDYQIKQQSYSGTELMNAGLVITDSSSGRIIDQNDQTETHDFDSRIWVLTQGER